MNKINERKPLGKGEVESSILSGSTSFLYKINAVENMLGSSPGTNERNTARTWNADPWKIRGMRSRGVHVARAYRNRREG